MFVCGVFFVFFCFRIIYQNDNIFIFFSVYKKPKFNFLKIQPFKFALLRGGELVQQLRALVALLEELCSVSVPTRQAPRCTDHAGKTPKHIK